MCWELSGVLTHDLEPGQVQKHVEFITQCSKILTSCYQALWRDVFPTLHFKQCYFSLLSPCFSTSPCEHYLFNCLPKAVCCFESTCKAKSYLGSPSLNVALPDVALMTRRGGITKCKFRHDLHSLHCWQKCCMNMMIQIGWIRQVWEANSE